MRKFIVTVIIILLAILGIDRLIEAKSKHDQPPFDFETNPPLIGDELYRSNRFTQPEVEEVYHYESTIDSGYELVAQNEHYELYLNKDKITFLIKDLTTNYSWKSALDHDLTTDEVNVERYANMMKSSFSIQYFAYDETLNENQGEYVRALQTAYLYDSEMPRRRDDKTIRSRISRDIEVEYQLLPNGVAIDIFFTDIEIGFQAEVTLNESGLNVHIPNESIREGVHKLATIYVMPFFGAARSGEVPGYMFIPDGVGALIRFKETMNQTVRQAVHKYFGVNRGVTNVLNEPYRTDLRNLTAPVFGMVHGVNQNGFLAIIEEGSYNANLVINPSGALNIGYNWLSSQFILRENFNLYGVNPTFEQTYNTENIRIQYQLLSHESANYVGMAKSYQQYLVQQGVLKRFNRNDVPLRLEILASDTKSGLFGPKVVPMTTTKQANDILDDLINADVRNLFVVMRGWNKGGVSGLTPYSIEFERKVGSKKDFEEFIESNKKRDIPIYFYNDYVIGYEESKQVRVRNDVAKSLHRIQMEYTNPNRPLYNRFYYLYPFKSAEIAKKDNAQYEKNHIENLALDSIGHILFSYYYKQHNYKREDTVNYYQNLLEELDANIALYRPNSYVWSYTSAYLDIPMYSSQYVYYTDTVPFLPIVLKGYMDYYAPFSNFNANFTDQFLLMIDYGAFPSYIVTAEPSYELKYTNSKDYYSTEYDVLKERIKTHYHQAREIQEQTLNATIINREVIQPGLVRVYYSNGIVIWINYTTHTYAVHEVVVEAKSVLVVGGDSA